MVCLKIKLICIIFLQIYLTETLKIKQKLKLVFLKFVNEKFDHLELESILYSNYFRTIYRMKIYMENNNRSKIVVNNLPNLEFQL